jgi:hypothetical protein
MRFDAPALLADSLGPAADDWVPHFNTGYYEGDWSGAALRSVGGVASQLYPDPTAQEAYADTPLLARCPRSRRPGHVPLPAARRAVPPPRPRLEHP